MLGRPHVASAFGIYKESALLKGSENHNDIKYIYIHVIHNNSQTHKVKCYKLVVCGNMFRRHCGHLQANFYKSSAFNVCTHIEGV
jgi:hypothetical protein